MMQLEQLGDRLGGRLPPQDELDRVIAEEVGMAHKVDPITGSERLGATKGDRPRIALGDGVG